MEITAKMIKALRDETSAGILDCKEALIEADGDVAKAKKILMAKSKAIASKKAGRSAKEGVISAYIHSGDRVGVMIEVNCESDFVARSDVFKEFVQNLNLQITAMSPRFVSIKDVDRAEMEEMSSLYKAEAVKSGKPEKVLDNIVKGRLNKLYQDIVLLEQPYVRDDSKKVKDVLTDVIGKLGENIVIKRFVRYELGN